MVVDLTDLAASSKKSVIRVLHVDDDSSMLEISKQIMMDMDCNLEFDSACCVDEAIKKLSTGEYDVVISDYEMPQKNGLEFLKELRDKNNQIPFILFTGRGREDVAVKALNLGADNYINKNGSPETVYCELADAIHKTVERKKSRKLLAKSESKYRLLVEKSLQGILLAKTDPLRIVFANDAMGKILGYSPQELMSLPSEGIISLVYNEDRVVFFKRMENRLKGELADACFEVRVVRKDGSIIWLSTLSNRVDYDEQPALQAMFLDITESKELEMEQKQKYAFLERVGESIGAGLAIISKDYSIFWANTLLRNTMVDGNKKCYQNFNCSETVCPDCGAKKVFEQNVSLDVHEFKTVNSKGETVWIELRVTPLKDKDGNVTAALELAVPITDRKKTEATLKESEARHRTISGLIADVAFSCIKPEGENFSIDWIIGATEDIFGRSIEEIKKRGCWKYLVDPQDLSIFEEKIGGLSAGQSSTCELRIISDHSSTRWIRVFSRVEKDKTTPKSYRLFGACEDITERRNAKLAIVESEEKFRVLAEESPNMIFINHRGRVVYANKKCAEITGYSREELYSPNFDFLSLNPPEYVETVKLSFAKHVRGETVPPYEYVLITRDGKRIITMINTSLIEYKGDKAVLGIVTDITQCKQAERLSNESEEKYRKLFEGSMDAIFVADIETGKIVDCNSAASKLVGRQKSELVGQHQSIFTPKEQMDGEFARVFKQHIRDPTKILETQITRKTGEIRDVAVRDTIIELKGKRLMQGTLSDITEHKKAEKSLKESEEKFRNLSEESPNMIFIYNRSRVIYANKKCEEILHYSREEFYSSDFNFFSIIAPESVEALKSSYTTHMNCEEVPPYEYVLVTRNGERIDAILASKLIDYEGEKAILGIVTDITERKKAEEKLNRMMDQLVLVNEKLNVVGGLTRHDVRNKLSTVTGYAYLLKKKHSDQADILDGVSKIEQTVKTTGEILDFAKMYEQLGIEELTYVNVKKTLEEAMALFPGSCSLEVVNDCHGLNLLTDSLLRQLFYNLIDNSLKHGEKVTKIRVYFKEVDQDKLIVVFEDDGVGISIDNKPELFKKGFSTSGTSGFGLFLIKKMVEVYGWVIEENGALGKGAKFIITIPRLSKNRKENYQIIP
jgi:PAS domain S-box-containing protein